MILAVLSPGDYVGEMSLIDNEPHSATVRAEVQTDMLILGRAEFARCLPENSSAVVRDHARPGAAPAQRRPPDRIAGAARRLRPRRAHAARHGREDGDGIKIIRNKVSRQDMAKVVGASREMVSRVMKDLEERGVIETQENGSVIVKERLQLHRLSGRRGAAPNAGRRPPRRRCRGDVAPQSST